MARETVPWSWQTGGPITVASDTAGRCALRQQRRGIPCHRLLGHDQPNESGRLDRHRRPRDQAQPHFGADWAWQSQPCATWSSHDADRFRGPYTEATANPVLFINATFDAASSLDQAAATSARLPGSRLLRLDGAAHPASFVPNTCLADATTRYFVEQELPPVGAVCQPDSNPFE